MPLSKTIRSGPEPVQALNEAFEQWLDNPTDETVRTAFREAFKNFLDYILDQVANITTQNEIEIRRIIADQVAANRKRIEVLEDQNADNRYSLNLLHKLYEYMDLFIEVSVKDALGVMQKERGAVEQGDEQ